jgi:ABC-type nitrate/sulfonate/bicarbonate transport system substrate-binding protein
MMVVAVATLRKSVIIIYDRMLICGDLMKISRRVLVGLVGATALARGARAADKIIGGTLGGQAPLWPFYIAGNKGFFAAQNIDVEINFAQSGAAVTQQLTGGAFDVALSVGITDPIHAIDKGAALALIRIVGKTAPYVLVGKPGLKTIADLKGKTVSIGAPNDVTTIYFERMAAANGLKTGDYDALSAGVAAARYAALRAGVADAALVLPPVNFQAAAAGYVTLGIAADYVKDLPFTGMAVRRAWAEPHVPEVKRLLAATDASIAWLTDQTHRGEAIDLLVDVGHAKKDDAAASYDFLRRIDYFEPTSNLSRAKLQNLIDTERKLGNVGAALTVDRLVMAGINEITD